MYDPDPDDPEEFDGVSMGGSMVPAAAATAKKIGEPSKDFRIRDSVAYSHNYFEPKDVDGEAHAICLMCQEEEEQAKVAGKSLPKFKRKKKMLLKTADGSTKRK